jgi:hypothetical protein
VGNSENSGDYVDRHKTRALQRNQSVIETNFQKLEQLGIFNIVKVSARSNFKREHVTGYITAITEIIGKTSAELETLLGLPKSELSSGADIYRVNRVPAKSEILLRGYTSMPNGLTLKPELATTRGDSNGNHRYRRGQSAWQVELKAGVKIPAILLGTIKGDERFEPGSHPRIAMLYPEGHPARANTRN